MIHPSAKFQQLDSFIRCRMRMSHIYQPVMHIELLKNGGTGSVAEIAKVLLAHDQSQIEYYEQITKNMVGDVLTSSRNGITEKSKQGRRVQGFRIPEFDQLTQAEVEALIISCESKISQYIESRGERIWSHRNEVGGVRQRNASV